MAPKASFSIDDLQDAVANIFNQVQTSMANHKKNCVNLYKFHVQAAGHIESNSRTTVKMVGEEAFANVFLYMLSRVLTVKKGIVSADRIVKFIGSYVKYMNERVRLEEGESISSGRNSAKKPQDNSDGEDTFVSRFVSKLLKWILRGFLAKDKNVRYRSIFLVSEMILWLGQVDIDIYEALRENLVERMTDKELFIRAQTVVALSRLSSIEDPNELEEGEKSILEMLTEIVVYDDEAEVRRAALLSTPLSRASVDVLLSCSRDMDLLIRKLLYSGVLYNKLESPRSLTLVQRETVVKDGLGDREASVRASATKLIMKWFDVILADAPDTETGIWEGDDGGVMKALVRFLELFDVIGGEQIALDALDAIFIVKPEYLDVFAFTNDYWAALTPESALLAHAFVMHSQGTARLDNAGLPMVTAFAFYIQSLYNKLLEALQAVESTEPLHNEEDMAEILEQLHKMASISSSMLSIAAGLDYGDEIGRRKAFSVVKDMLTHPGLPLDLVDPCMEVMKGMLPSEREFIRVIVEIIIDLRDGDEPAEELEASNASMLDISQSTTRRERLLKQHLDREEMGKEGREATDLTDLRCLMICNSVLERINGPFEDNSTLQGILDDLIIPSIQRKELILREKALSGLGLCSLIAKRMALGSFQLFCNECMRGPDSIRTVVLRVVFDLLLMYEREFFGNSAGMDSKLVDFLLSIMEAELGKDEPCGEILSVLCVGFSKLLLLGIVDDPKMLLCLLVAFVSPDTMGNQEARQCLSYFFARYSMAHPRNKLKLQSIFMTALDAITRLSESLDDPQVMISSEKFGEMLLAWSDPQFGLEIEDIGSARDIHANIAIDILLALYDSKRPESDLRVLCHLLNRPLYFPEDLDRKIIHMIDVLLSNHDTQCPFDVAATAKAFDRFKSRFHKTYSNQLTKIHPRDFVHDAEVLKLYEAINVDAPDIDSDGEMDSRSPLGKEMSSVENKVSAEPSDGSDENIDAGEDEDDTASDQEDRDPAEQAAFQNPLPGLIDGDHCTGAKMTRSRATVTTNALSTPVSVTPKRKKRVRTPDSNNPTPSDRKRNRVAPTTKSESESDDGDVTPTPVKSKPRAQVRIVPAAKTLQSRPSRLLKGKDSEPVIEKSGKNTRSKKVSVSGDKVDLGRPVKTSRGKTNKTIAKATARGRRNLRTPPPPSDESNGEDEDDQTISPELTDNSSDDLATYSDEL